MKKLKLDPDHLRVESFAAVEGSGAGRGTVHARDSRSTYEFTCNPSYEATCDPCTYASCDANSCQDLTCGFTCLFGMCY